MESGWRARWPGHMAAADGAVDLIISFAILSGGKCPSGHRLERGIKEVLLGVLTLEVYQCRSIHFSYLPYYVAAFGHHDPAGWLGERPARVISLSPLAHSGPV